MPTVRTTFQPDQDLVVSDREAYDLRTQGLLVDDDAAPEQDPSATTAPVDAEQHDKDQAQAKREELGEDKAKAPTRGKTKNEGADRP